MSWVSGPILSAHRRCCGQERHLSSWRPPGLARAIASRATPVGARNEILPRGLKRRRVGTGVWDGSNRRVVSGGARNRRASCFAPAKATLHRARYLDALLSGRRQRCTLDGVVATAARSPTAGGGTR